MSSAVVVLFVVAAVLALTSIAFWVAAHRRPRATPRVTPPETDADEYVRVIDISERVIDVPEVDTRQEA